MSNDSVLDTLVELKCLAALDEQLKHSTEELASIAKHAQRAVRKLEGKLKKNCLDDEVEETFLDKLDEILQSAKDLENSTHRLCDELSTACLSAYKAKRSVAKSCTDGGHVNQGKIEETTFKEANPENKGSDQRRTEPGRRNCPPDSAYGSINGSRVYSESERLVAHPTDDTSLPECSSEETEIHLTQGISDTTNVFECDA